jgi:hypothetical protein
MSAPSALTATEISHAKSTTLRHSSNQYLYGLQGNTKKNLHVNDPLRASLCHLHHGVDSCHVNIFNCYGAPPLQWRLVPVNLLPSCQEQLTANMCASQMIFLLILRNNKQRCRVGRVFQTPDADDCQLVRKCRKKAAPLTLAHL